MKRHRIMIRNVTIGVIVTLWMGMFSGCRNESLEKTQNSMDSKKVEIEFFQQKTEAVDLYNEIIKKFEVENPNIDVVQNNVPDTRNVLLSRMASGDMPDVFSVYPNAPEFKVQGQEGYIYDLSDQKFLKNVNPSILESIKQNRKDYSLPISLNTVGVFYNTDVFLELNLSVPKTYAEFIHVAEKIKAAGKTPFALMDKEASTVGITASLMMGMEMEKEQVDQFFNNLITAKQTASENTALNNVADKIVELRKYGLEDSLTIDYYQGVNLFATEKAAMLIGGIWAIPQVEKANSNLKFDIFPFPASVEKDTRLIYGIDAAVSISASTKHPKEALKFLDFLAKQETAQYFSDQDHSPSAIKGVKVNYVPVQKLAQMINDKKAFEWLHFKWPAGVENQWNNTAQELAVTKDKNRYFKQVDSIFKNSNQQF